MAENTSIKKNDVHLGLPKGARPSYGGGYRYDQSMFNDRWNRFIQPGVQQYPWLAQPNDPRTVMFLSQVSTTPGSGSVSPYGRVMHVPEDRVYDGTGYDFLGGDDEDMADKLAQEWQAYDPKSINRIQGMGWMDQAKAVNDYFGKYGGAAPDTSGYKEYYSEDDKKDAPDTGGYKEYYSEDDKKDAPASPGPSTAPAASAQKPGLFQRARQWLSGRLGRTPPSGGQGGSVGKSASSGSIPSWGEMSFRKSCRDEGYSDEAIDAAIGMAKSEGYVDDDEWSRIQKAQH